MYSRAVEVLALEDIKASISWDLGLLKDAWSLAIASCILYCVLYGHKFFSKLLRRASKQGTF